MVATDKYNFYLCSSINVVILTTISLGTEIAAVGFTQHHVCRSSTSQPGESNNEMETGPISATHDIDVNYDKSAFLQYHRFYECHELSTKFSSHCNHKRRPL